MLELMTSNGGKSPSSCVDNGHDGWIDIDIGG
jgi:hypothetical protein